MFVKLMCISITTNAHRISIKLV